MWENADLKQHVHRICSTVRKLSSPWRTIQEPTGRRGNSLFILKYLALQFGNDKEAEIHHETRKLNRKGKRDSNCLNPDNDFTSTRRNILTHQSPKSARLE